jgi:DNA polymerase III epsilon subunit family exonuclease
MTGGIEEQVFCIVDTETASIEEVKSARICEIGVIKTRNGEVLERFQTLVNPTVPMSAGALQIHRISDDMVKGAPKFGEVAPRVSEFLRGTILVAHNTAFDATVINSEFQRAGLAPWKGACIDTIQLARKGFAGIPSYGLDSLIKFFELNVPERHRVMGDCEATLIVFWKCVNRLKELGKVRTLLDLVELGRNRHLERVKWG